MQITVLGSRGEIEEAIALYEKHSGLLIDQKLLFDLGEEEYLQYNPKAIFITHWHPDHAYFVRWGKESDPQISVPIYAPEPVVSKKIKIPVEVLHEPIQLFGYTITPIPTHHSKLVKSQAYLIQKGKKALLYTGDLIWIDKEYHPLFSKVDLVITEASFLRKGGMVRKDKETGALFGHQGIPNLIQLFKNYTPKILLVHFGGWFYKDVEASEKAIKRLAEENNIEILIGHDQLKIEI